MMVMSVIPFLSVPKKGQPGNTTLLVVVVPSAVKEKKVKQVVEIERSPSCPSSFVCHCALSSKTIAVSHRFRASSEKSNFKRTGTYLRTYVLDSKQITRTRNRAPQRDRIQFQNTSRVNLKPSYDTPLEARNASK